MTDISTALAGMRATADLDARAGAPVGAALRRAVAAVEAVTALADDKIANPEHIELHGRHSIVSAHEVRQAIADALSGDHHAT